MACHMHDFVLIGTLKRLGKSKQILPSYFNFGGQTVVKWAPWGYGGTGPDQPTTNYARYTTCVYVSLAMANRSTWNCTWWLQKVILSSFFSGNYCLQCNNEICGVFMYAWLMLASFYIWFKRKCASGIFSHVHFGYTYNLVCSFISRQVRKKQQSDA